MQESEYLRSAARELSELLTPFDDATWWRATPFKSWTAFDVVAHLHFSDQLALMSIEEPERFRARMNERKAQLAGEVPGLPREAVETREPEVLFDAWQKTLARLCDRLDALDPATRLPWAGPDMGARTFATARLMEVWAHAQDVYDLLKKPRVHHDWIRPIAELGVRTYGWTFVNRGLPAPAPKPWVRLVGPSGATWEWNDPHIASSVIGNAVEFCQVVTQGRHVRDTGLQVVGDSASRWMEIAQCFAGVPRDPPAPGSRAWERQ